MGEVVKFSTRPRMAAVKSSKGCQHQWREQQDESFVPPTGHSVAVYRCARCGAMKTVTRRE